MVEKVDRVFTFVLQWKAPHTWGLRGRKTMSASANIFTAVGTSWVASAVGFIAYAIKTAKAEDTKFTAYITHIEAEFDNVLTELQTLETKLTALIPAPTPAPVKAVAKAKAPVKKTAPAKHLR